MSRPSFEQYATPEQLESQINHILDRLEADKRPPTLERLAYELGVSKETLALYRNPPPGEDGEAQEPYRTFSRAVKRAYQRVEAWLVERTLGTTNPVGAMFTLKCAHGWIEEEKRRNVQLGSSGDPITIEVRLVGSSDSAVPSPLSPTKPKVQPKKTAKRKPAK